ncbi:hypothetical protein PRUPE_4G233700 [Prunus persica]|uniref:Ubiquitin thioesterase OTU n=1 Tax=Prunus persica TaxID=3760 RepID=A0A251PPV3_PRUPE|nr:hypothetical protein PRUPE_4G233700 [Prunus persica]
MEGIVVRRAIPSDNSCLFNAVGYAIDHDKKKAPELRQVIAATVASDPTKYSEAFLGKPNEEYCSWILDSEKWGECLCPFSYGVLLTRALLIYDGLHYDALALMVIGFCIILSQMSPFEELQRSLIRLYLQLRTVPLGRLRGSLLIL